MFYNNFVDLCNAKGVSPTQAAEQMGFHKSQVTRWRKEESNPRQATIQKMMKYFQCSADDLLRETDNGQKNKPADYSADLTDAQKKLIQLLPHMSEAEVNYLLRNAEDLIELHKSQDAK